MQRRSNFADRNDACRQLVSPDLEEIRNLDHCGRPRHPSSNELDDMGQAANVIYDGFSVVEQEKEVEPPPLAPNKAWQDCMLC
jgi:hypothetical protein